MKNFWISFLFCAVACSSPSDDSPKVTTADAAILSAKQAWAAIEKKSQSSSFYSRESTARFEPYTATLDDGVWYVRGTIPDGYRGDIIETQVRRDNGSVSVKIVKMK